VDRREHGSRKTVKYPSIYLRGENATADIISVAVAGKGQHQDTGAKAILSPRTTKAASFRSPSRRTAARATYRGQLKVSPGAQRRRQRPLRRADARRHQSQRHVPYIDIQEDDTTMTHEATVGKISAEQVFYLMSRGLTRTRRRT